MTSNTRAAEAIQVAPYLTHVVSHHGRLTLIPPENAGRPRKASKLQAKKEKKSARRGGERSARSEDSEEARFNLGTPRSVRSVTSSTSARRRPARSTGETRSRGAEGNGYGEGGWALFGKHWMMLISVDINIPDYPPPTFQEATSSSTSSRALTLSIPQSPVRDAYRSITGQLSTNSSPMAEPSPITSVTPSQRVLSIIVEPPTSLPSSPNPTMASLPSPPPSTSTSPTAPSFPQQSSNTPPRSNSPLPPTPKSPESDSESDSREYVCLPLEPSQRQWEEDRQLGLTLEERVQRELKRQRAAQADDTQLGSDAQSQPQSPTYAGSLECKSQETLGSDPARKGRTTLRVPHPDWRLTLDEPSLRSVTSAPSLTTQFSQKPRSPRSPLRLSSPTSATSRPYHSAGPASSTLSLSLAHLRLPGTFTRSTTSLGLLSGQTGGRENTGPRRLFSKGKGKEKERSSSDGDLDDRDEETLDSWEIIDEQDIDVQDPSTKVRPKLTLKSHLKTFDISTTYGEKPVEGRRAGDNDTRVDPFPISAEPSSPETERPSSISPTPTNFYPPSTPFSVFPHSPTATTTPSFYPTSCVLDQNQVQARRQRCASMRTRQAPPLPAAFLDQQIRRPAPPPLHVSSIRPISPTSPSMPSRGLRTKSPIHLSADPYVQVPMKRPTANWAPEPYDRAPEVSTLPDANLVRFWTPTLSAEKEPTIEREVGRRYSYAPGPHSYFNTFPTYMQVPSSASSDFPMPVRARPAVDYAHVPPVSSRLAVSIPTHSHCQPSSPSVGSSPATPRGHYPGRPLPLTPSASSPITAYGHSFLPSAHIVQNRSQGEIQDQIHSIGNVPEGLLIDLETDLDSNNSGGSSSIGEGRTDRTVTAGNFSNVSANSADRGSVFEINDGLHVASSTSAAATAPERSQLLEYTDLDVLLSRMEDESHNGSDYDVRTACPAASVLC
jgi:hypothetical protein